MDNSTTTWIIVALLVLLIGAAIFMLLRRPGGDDSLDSSDTPAMGRDSDRPATDRPGIDRSDTDRRDDLGGRTAPEEAQGVAAVETPARDDAPFDQSSYDAPAGTGGATPVDRADVQDLAGGTTEAARPADDFFGVDREPREEVEPDPVFQDPRTDGHLIADDAHHDAAPLGEGDTAAPASEGYTAAPASEGYTATPASGQVYEQADEAPPAAAEPPRQQDEHQHPDHVEHVEQGAAGVQDEPLTADEVLDARDVADRDRGDGYAEPPVAAEPVAQEPVVVEPVADEPAVDEQTVAEQPAVEDQQDAPVGGHVFAESVYGAGSVEPAEDGSGPQGWEIKGNTGSMLFHTVDSPSYDAVRAEVWFDSEESARNAGFAHWDRRRR